MIDTIALSKILAKPAIKTSLPLFSKLKDNISHYYNDGFLDYYNNSLEKYSKIKTLLYRQPTNFYDIYFPLSLRCGNISKPAETLSSLFSDTNFVTILGLAGSGKSTLIHHLFISAFFELYKAPIYIALRDLEFEDANLELYIRKNILNNKLSPSDDYLNKLLKSGEFIFFLDGYDEIKSSEKQKITRRLEEFIDKYPNNNFLLTSRPYSNIEYFKNFHNYSIQELTIDERKNFIKLQVKEEELATKIISSLENIKEVYIDSFLKNSLLLTLYIITYRKNSSIPTNKYIFYSRVLDVLFVEHDSATKIGFDREIQVGLSQEEIEGVLQKFSFLSFFENVFDFEKKYINDLLNKIKKTNLNFNNNHFIEDMKLSIGLWIEDSGMYQFSHRSLQEYFASVFVTNVHDISNKKTIYTTIVNNSLNGFFDMNNFLSLCFEMDKNYFIKNYSLIIINKIKEYLIDKKGNFKFPLNFCNEGFHGQFSDEGNRLMSWGYSNNSPMTSHAFITPTLNYDSNGSEIIKILLTNKTEKIFTEIFEKRIENNSDNDFRDIYKIKESEKYTEKTNNFLHKIGIYQIIEDELKKINEIEETLNNELKKDKREEDYCVSMLTLNALI